MQIERGIGVAVTGRILISSRCTCVFAQTAVAFSHFERDFAAERTLFLFRKLIVYLAVSAGCVEVFSAGHLLVGRGELRAAASGE